MDTKKLFDAARCNDLQEVKHHMEGKTIPASVKYNIAHIAAEAGNLDILQYVTEGDPSILIMDGKLHNYALLLSAISHGALDVVKYLINKSNQTVGENHFSREAVDRAIEFDRLNVLKYFVNEKKFDLSWLYHNGAHSAIKFNQLDILKYLIEEKHIDIHEVTIYGKKKPLLEVASEYEHNDIFKYLVEQTKPNSTMLCQYGMSVLCHAVTKGDLVSVKYILDDLKIEANIDGVDCDRSVWSMSTRKISLLFFAVDNGHYDIAKYLIEKKGANLTMLNENGENVLFISLKFNNVEFFKYILDKVEIDVNHRNNKGDTLVHSATQAGKFEVLKYLVEEKRVDVNRPNMYMETPIYGAESGKVGLYLIEHGARIDYKNINGDTPLHILAQKDFTSNDQVKLIKHLIKHGANVNQKNYDGKSPLILVCDDKSENCDRELQFRLARCLINSGADVNFKDSAEKTPLHYVVKGWDLYEGTHAYASGDTPIQEWRYNDKLCKFLIKRGADLNMEDKDGNTPLDVASSHYENERLCIYLLDHGALANHTDCHGQTLLNKAIECGWQDLSKHLLKRGADPNLEDSQGRTPLDIALKELQSANVSSMRQLCLYLIGHGAFTNRTDSHGSSLLHKAIEIGCEDLSKSIIEHGADLNQRNEHGDTPLHMAASQGLYDTCQHLVKYGADTRFKDQRGKTPAQVAKDAAITKYLHDITKKRKRRNVVISSEETKSMPFHYISNGILREYATISDSKSGPESYSLTETFIPKFPSLIFLIWALASIVDLPAGPLIDGNGGHQFSNNFLQMRNLDFIAKDAIVLASSKQ